MNTPKILTAGILAAAALISTASAQTKIYITGSTAFRSAATDAITATVGTAGATSADNADPHSANFATWTGGTVSGNPVTIKAAWSGSASGVQTVSNSIATVFLNDSAPTLPTVSTTAVETESAVPDICLADCQQTSTPFTANGLTQHQVGVVAFTFAASNGFPSGLSMTKQAFQYNFSGVGAAPLSWYTGLASDATGSSRIAYAVGRDPDSGTRITALAESGYGVNNVVTQFQPTVSGSTITNLHTYTGSTTINGITYPASDFGEHSGGNLRAFLNLTLTSGAYQYGESGPSFVVTYLGVADFLKVYTGTFGGLTGSYAGSLPAVPLAWNGTSYSQAAIENGGYTFWGYEYLSWLPALAGTKLTFGNNLVTNIKATPTSGLSGSVALSDMQVTRTGDGGPVTSLNF